MRNRPPQESDGSRLKAFHHRLKSLVAEEFDDYKYITRSDFIFLSSITKYFGNSILKSEILNSS